MNHPASEELTEAQKRIHSDNLEELERPDFTKKTVAEQFGDLEQRRRQHIRLSSDDPEYTIRQSKDYIPEVRKFLIRKDEFDELKAKRDEFIKTGGTNFDEAWWRTAMGFNRESLYSGIQNAGKFFTPDLLGRFTGTKKTAIFDASETYGNENSTITRRECDWFMHQFHTCLRAYNKTDNPYLLFPHPDMPKIFSTWGFTTNMAASSENYFNHDCIEFRLLATQMCDDLEMAEYVRTENYRWKKYWLLNKKEELKENFEKLKSRLPSFGSSDVPEPEKKIEESSFINPNLLDVDKKYQQKYQEKLYNKLGMDEPTK